MDKEAKNVYIITQGCYSDYSIVTVFDDKDKAKAFVEAYNKNKRKYQDEYCIETYKINDIDVCSSEGKIYFCVSTNYRGDLRVEPAVECDLESVGVVKKVHYLTWYSYSVIILAENIDKAKKIAADKIAEYKANEEGIT